MTLSHKLGLERYWYWVLGNICRYWVVLLLGDIFFHWDTQYDTDQTAVSTVHMITILTSVVPATVSK